MTAYPEAGVKGRFRCTSCGQVLLIVGDASAPSLPAEIAVKVDGHSCPVLPPNQA